MSEKTVVLLKSAADGAQEALQDSLDAIAALKARHGGDNTGTILGKIERNLSVAVTALVHAQLGEPVEVVKSVETPVEVSRTTEDGKRTAKCPNCGHVFTSGAKTGIPCNQCKKWVNIAKNLVDGPAAPVEKSGPCVKELEAQIRKLERENKKLRTARPEPVSPDSPPAGRGGPILTRSDITCFDNLIENFNEGGLVMAAAVRKADGEAVALLCTVPEDERDPKPCAVLIGEDCPDTFHSIAGGVEL